MSAKEEQVISLKEQGNDAVKEGKYAEAILHYTHAIKMDPKNFSLYSNRSYAFLKMQQYFYAMEDAKETISLKPDWAKGYFRKAEIEYATSHFPDAYHSYSQALILKPDDCDIANAVDRANKEWKRDLKADEQIPWLGAGVGIVLGVAIVIADFICTKKPTLSHPILMVTLTIAVALLGYFAAKGFRYYTKCQRSSLLDAPINLVDNESDKNETEETSTNKTPEKTERGPRYTKTQARFRYKKGKL